MPEEKSLPGHPAKATKVPKATKATKAATNGAPPKKATDAPPNALFYVGIGASAGGLEALRPFVANLPESANMTYIVAQHMSPDHRSLMVELLARETKLKVEPVQNNLMPLANTVYVAPANTDITISGGKLRLSKPSNTIGPKPSINRLFLSLAQDREEKCIGIVLSGTGSDGAHGIKAIKAAGGITIGQDPRSAKYDSMPNAAIRTGGADLVLPPSEIAMRLNALISRPRATLAEERDDLPPSTMRGIVHQIATQTGMDFTSYKEATLSRQIIRRMMAKQIASIEEYGKYLNKNEQELRDLANNFLICVTSFFRDPEAFDALRKTLKLVLEKKQPGEDIRIWIPACATGEEVYSVAILLMEDLGERINQHRIQLFATDMNTDAVHTARAGVYPETALIDVSDNLIQKYFSVQNGMYLIDKRLKDMILFARQDLTQDPPFVRLDMVCCRNLLIYFKPELQEKVMKVFHYSLRDSGILFLGKSESVGKSTTLFSETDRKNKIYIKRNTATRLLGNFGRSKMNLGGFESRAEAKTLPTGISLHTTGIEQLFNIYAPPSVLITQEGEVIEVFGDCSDYLSIRKGKADFNLFSLIDPAFKAELRAFVHRVAKKRASAYSMPVKLMAAGKEELVRLAVHYAGDQNKADSDLLLVSFEKPELPKPQMLDAESTSAEIEVRVTELQQELLLNRENLQSVIEELETANEELQALNEEAQASNEELQASNEELETANEELQASNEELTTVNDELGARTSDLSHLNNDLNNVLESIYKGLLVVDSKLMITRFNKKALSFFDIPQDTSANLATVRTKYEMPELLKCVQQVMARGELVEYEFNDNYQQYFLMRLAPYVDKSAAGVDVSGVVIALLDITEKKEAEEKLKLSASVFEHAAEATMISDGNNTILTVNPAFTRITGYDLQEVIGKTPRILNSGKQPKEFFKQMWESIVTTGMWKGEVQNKRKNGEIYTEFLSINVLRDIDGKIIRHIAVFSDISDAKKAQEVIERQASYDSLTGLPNRNLIQERLNQQLLHSRRNGLIFAVLFLDLDDFKSINDSLGHGAGDELIIKVGMKLRSMLREVDTVGRLGGDEFIILLNDLASTDDVAYLANKILTELREPLVIAGHTIHTSASIGVTVYPADGDSTDALMKNADSAMYQSKHKGRNTYSFFTHQMQDEANKRQWIMSELAIAIKRKQLYVHYQPIIDLATMKVSGAEALLRWKHPQKGMIPPDQFIAIAEQTGLIINIAEWVLNTVLSVADLLQEKFDTNFSLAVNVSMAQFVSHSHMEWMIKRLREFNVSNTNKITIELTESIKLVDNEEYRTLLSRIKDSGSQIALDDFGTGQSSLSYIKKVPVNIVKIDRSFVSDIATDPNDAAMIQAILQMAKAFDLTTVAEGVENQEQLDFLEKNGCHYAQGFFFSKALPYDEFLTFVRAFNQDKH